MREFVITILVGCFVLTIAVEVLKFIWRVLWFRVFGFKPVALDEKQLERTVAYCPKEFIRAAKELHPEYASLSEEDERRVLDDMTRYTDFVVRHYFEGAKA